MQFNFLPERYSHPSWLLTESMAQLRPLLSNHKRAARLFSEKLLHDHDLDEQYDFDFDNSHKHFALLAHAEQKLLVFRLGLVIYRTRIAALLDRPRQQKVRQLLNDTNYDAVLRFNRGTISQDNLPAMPLDDRRKFNRLVFLAGITLLSIVMAAEPRSYVVRLKMIWPRHQVDKYWQLLVKNKLSGVLFNSLGSDDDIAHWGRVLITDLLAERAQER